MGVNFVCVGLLLLFDCAAVLLLNKQTCCCCLARFMSINLPDLQRVALKVDLVSSVGGFSLGMEGKGKEHSKLPHHEGEDLCCQAVVAYLTSCLAQDK